MFTETGKSGIKPALQLLGCPKVRWRLKRGRYCLQFLLERPAFSGHGQPFIFSSPLAFFLAGLVFLMAFAGRPAAALDNPIPSTLERHAGDFGLNRARFESLVESRHIVDQMQVNRHKTVGYLPPAVESTGFAQVTPAPRQEIRLARTPYSRASQHYRNALGNQRIPHPAYRAPILDRASKRPSITLELASLSPNQRRAVTLISERLSSWGCLKTLAGVLDLLGAEAFCRPEFDANEALEAVGFPSDLLIHFQMANQRPVNRHTNNVRVELAKLVKKGASADEIGKWIQGVRFKFQPTDPRFEGFAESGNHAIGAVRMQVGGGYDEGIIPGGALDIIDKVMNGLPAADVYLTTPNDLLSNISGLAISRWNLSRPGRLTLISDPGKCSPWTQDHSKGGWVVNAEDPIQRAATIVPRFASIGERNSRFQPVESFIADGLHRAGHVVVHSPLLFQGGNLFIVDNPSKDRRTLLLGEAEVYRNHRLGLSTEQILDAFSAEFSVDQVAIIPAVSHHIDLDLTVRIVDQVPVAFINDPRTAAREIIRAGLAALEKAGVVTGRSLAEAQTGMNTCQDDRLYQALAAPVYELADDQGRFSMSLVSLFRKESSDHALVNFKCFMIALDFLGADTALANPKTSASHRDYYHHLQTLQTNINRQADALSNLGWQVVRIPSFPDMNPAINYVNGIQDAERFLMPSFGGFYEAVDEVAAGHFAKVITPPRGIIRIRSSDLQSRHGSVHCVTVTYPKMYAAAEKCGG